MALPIIPIAAGAAVLLLMMKGKSQAAAPPAPGEYGLAPSDGSAPAVKEPKPPAKTWKEMPQALQEQVASALGALGVSPATGQLSGGPVTADAIKMATQTAALCEAQGFYDIAKELRKLAAQAAPRVPTPPAAEAMKPAAPAGLTAAQVEAITRTLTLDRDPKAIAALISMLEKLPPSPQKDSFVGMAKALLLQLQAAQSTTQTLQQIDEVIKSPGVAEVVTAVKPLPPVIVPVTPPAPPPSPQRSPAPPPPPPPPAAAIVPTAPAPGDVMDRPALPRLDDFADPAPKARVLKLMPKGPGRIQGEDVKSWQRILKRFGYDLGTYGPNKDGVDGDFGNATDSATKAFQAWGRARYNDPRIVVDGDVGPITRRLVLMRNSERLTNVSGRRAA